MPHSKPDFHHRSQLVELMDGPCTRDELRACLCDIAWINRWTMAYRPVLRWLDSIAGTHSSLVEPLRILDVACGYGDGLRRIEHWAATRGISVQLTGLDLNPDATAIATEASPGTSRIQWVSSDVFAYTPPNPVHLVISSLFTHHLSESDVVRFLQWMEQHATLGWLIIDLSRAAIPYYFIRAVSKLARLHHFVQYDAPVSIARSFVKEDWRRMCAAAGLGDHDVFIHAIKPARLCVARKKPQ